MLNFSRRFMMTSRQTVQTINSLESAMRIGRRAVQSVLPNGTAASSSLSSPTARGHSNTSASYLSAVCTELGKPLQIQEQQRASLSNNEVRIVVKHAALNFSDILKTQGKYQEKPQLPFTPGGEITGLVVEVGPKVTSLKSGDHVIGFSLSGNGGFAQELVTNDESCYKIEDHARLSPAEGAALVISYGTAQVALKRRVNIQKNDIVLVTAAAGALGLAIVDLAANVYGAKVIGACGGAEKCALVRRYGASETIDYMTENLRDRLKELTKGRGVDIIADVVGGKVLEDALKNIAYEGRVLTLGYTSGDIPKIPVNVLLVKNYSIHGCYWGSYSWNKPAVFKDSVEEVIRLWIDGKIKPHFGNVFPLEKVNDAMLCVMKRQSTGKVLLDCEVYEKSKI